MKKVDQIYIDKLRGDCHRAAIASLLELELEQVPHFRLFDNDKWFNVYNGFMWGCGWQFEGSGYPRKERGLLEEDSINGFFYASVKSRTFEGATHAVIINQKGLIVHDPNPNKKWLHVNILKTGELLSWHMFSKVDA